ncbi:MAG: DUF4358 domain-containing protein [Clostridia bacterium]|nr:DUF4358 domain-containing protein [Clostridia bacterium]
MKNRRIKAAIAVILTLLSAVFSLAACNQKEDEKYKKEINTQEIATTLSQKTPTASAWINEDQYFIEEYVDIPDYIKESSIYYAKNTNDLDEFGIFLVEEGKEKATRLLLLQGYLQKRYTENQEWYNSYMPTETPKLRDAEVRIYGNCVVYAVLSAEQRTAFFAECEKLLKEQK